MIKYAAYGLAVCLAILITVLILVSPSTFEDTRSVYQGF
jgi:hypothetical protein